jgi:HEPN domain-containing protein
VFIGLGLPFPLIHHLGRLFDLLEDSGESIPPAARAADTLTIYAVVTRYPLPPGAPVTEDELRDAVDAAQSVLIWAEERLGIN